MDSKIKEEREMIRLLKEDDIHQWQNIIREVEPLFGSMLDDPTFLPAIKEAIKANIVFGYEDNMKHEIVGVVVVNRETNSIEWLAVSMKQKKGGIGSKLLEKAILELDNTKDITVQTFAQEVEAGIPARKLYQKYDFIDLENAGKNPAGLNTVIMIKKYS